MKYVLMSCAKEKIPIEEVPIRTIYRDENNSNSHFRSFMDSIRIYKDSLILSLPDQEDLVARILENLTPDQRAAILSKRSVANAAVLTEKMQQ